MAHAHVYVQGYNTLPYCVLYEGLSQKYKNLTITVSSKIFNLFEPILDIKPRLLHSFLPIKKKKKTSHLCGTVPFQYKGVSFREFWKFLYGRTKKKGVPNRQNLDIPFASPSSFIFTNLYLKFRPFRVISPIHPSPTSLLIAFPTLTFALFSSFSRYPLRRSRLSFGAGQLLSPLYSA